MTIHPEQKNVRALCELTDCIDSGYQSFREQTRDLPPFHASQAAFYAGAGLSLRLLEHFKSSHERYSAAEIDCLTGLLFIEINEFMEKNGLKLEWEPHVPSRWQT
jgi:hypothetical protein